MFKSFICKSCKWILDKLDDKSDSEQFVKTSVRKIQIVNNKQLVHNVIDKVFYFLNVGDTEHQPYMDVCINSYKEHNPDFDVKFINMSKEDFYNLDMVKDIIAEHEINLDLDSIDDFYKILYYFKFKWLCINGGVICDINTYCCKELSELLQYESFTMSKSMDANVTKDFSCMGIKKGLDIIGIDNVIYPPMNFDDENYESMKISFFNGTLNSSMFNHIINKKMHNYIYKFDR